MNRIAQDIMNFLQRYPGLSDRELTNLIFGALEPPDRSRGGKPWACARVLHR